MIQWWYSVAGQAAGPCDYDALVQLYRAGSIDAQTPVWHEGMGSWQAISELPELRGIVLPSPAMRTGTIPGGSPYPQPRRSHTTGIVLGIVGMVIVLAVLFIGAAVWKGYREDRARRDQAQSQVQTPAAAQQATRVWQNPVTLLQAYVDEDWNAQAMPDASGTWYSFVQPDQSSGMMLKAAPENVNNYTLREVVPQVMSALNEEGFVLDGAGQYIEEEALPGWILTGSSKAFPGKKATMQVVQTKKTFWIIVTLRPMYSQGSEEKLKRLHRAIISTIT